MTNVKITFEEFITLFNNLSKLFYTLLNGDPTKLRSYNPVVLFDEYFIFDELLSKDNIKEKFVIPIKENFIIKIFILDKDELEINHHGINTKTNIHCIDNISLFENSIKCVSFYISSDIISEDQQILYFLYKDILFNLFKFIFVTENKIAKVNTGKDEHFIYHRYPKNISILSDIFAGVIIIPPKTEDNKFIEISEKIVNLYAHPNCDYIKLAASKDLMLLLDNLFIV